MKCSPKEINQLIEKVRAGNPPKPAGNRFEDIYYDQTLPNFGIRMLHTGAAIWSVQKKANGRLHKKSFGDVRIMDRAKAIEEARNFLAKIQLGLIDPQADKRERMRANKVTFESQVPLFFEWTKNRKKGPIRRNTEEAWRRYLTGGYYFKSLYPSPIDEITSTQISAALDTVKVESGRGSAFMAHTAINVFFKWAMKTAKFPEGHRNPMDRVERPANSEPRKRVLTDPEIRQIWNACDEWEAEVLYEIDPLTEKRPVDPSTGKRRAGGAPANPYYPPAVKLLFLTGMRLREVGDLKWSELDLEHGAVKILAERMKNKRDLWNPLADWALEILRPLKHNRSAYVFPTVRRSSQKGSKGSIGDGYGRSNHLINERIAKSGTPTTLVRENGKPNWTLHDIRRTFRTRLNQLKVPKEVAKALISHVGGDRDRREDSDRMEETYNQDPMWPQKREALAKWDDRLRAIITGTAPVIEAPVFGQKSA